MITAIRTLIYSGDAQATRAFVPRIAALTLCGSGHITPRPAGFILRDALARVRGLRSIISKRSMKLLLITNRLFIASRRDKVRESETAPDRITTM